MDLEEAEQWLNSSSSSGNEIPKGISSHNLQSYPNFDPQPKWDCPSILDYGIGIDPPFPELNQPTIPASASQANNHREWDPKTMLSNLAFLEQKIHQLQDLVHLIAGRQTRDERRQRHLVTADVASVIAQLISAAGNLLPPAPPPEQAREEPELKEEEEHEHEAEDGESLAPGTYEILQLEKEEILAPHTHFCAICGKGFKRDANLRMHMRGHGDEYKTAAALAKPSNAGPAEPAAATKRYSCPFGGCKRNREHKKFQPLKTILCVKNHYKRTHCDKSFTCSRCKAKKFSVIADLKTHEKHCGKDKWLCSCGTTFSRKDKLFGHISLFQGHTPAIPLDDARAAAEAPAAAREKGSSPAAVSLSFGFGFGSGSPVKDTIDEDQTAIFSPMNFDTSSFGGFHEFPRPPYEDSESSFSLLLSGSCNYTQKTLGDSPTNNFV